MSRSFGNNSSNYLQTASSTDRNLQGRTVLAYVKLNNIQAANQCAVFAGSTSSADIYTILGIEDTGYVTPGAVRANYRNSSGQTNRAEAVSTGVWTPILTTFSTTTGEARTTGPTWASRNTTDFSVTSFTPGASHAIAIGRASDSTPGEPLDGLISHVAIWNAILSDADLQSLAEGANPTTIAAGDREHYWAFTDASLTDSWGSLALTVNGTVSTDVDNPTFGGGGSSPTPFGGMIGGGLGLGLIK